MPCGITNFSVTPAPSPFICGGFGQRWSLTRRGLAISKRSGVWGTSLSRSLSVTRSLPRPIVGWPGALLAVALASASGLLIARILLDPGAGDLGDLAIYFAVSGVGTVT